jgi:Do/DeqQ family serine protease
VKTQGARARVIGGILIALGLVGLGWSLHDRLPGMQPGTPKGPLADVHPEVLNLQASFSNVAQRVKPSVVSISTVRIERRTPQFFFGDPMEQFFNDSESPGEVAPRHHPPRRSLRKEGVGSGVIIDPAGLVLTNDHVISDADEIKVLIYDQAGEKKEYAASLVGKDERTDLAVVRIHAGRALPFASLGDSDQVNVGDWAVAIGSPFGLAQTVTVGVISAARQSLVIEDRDYHNLIQTDAAINRGNSGGPLLNIHGEVVGINAAIYAPTGVFAGIGFAVPINQAKSILKELISRGKVVRGWLGVELGHEITPAMVDAFGLANTYGALINGVVKESPADKAGLRRGDVIKTFAGKPVKSSDDLQGFVTGTVPKTSIPLEIVRARKTISLTLVVGERPESADGTRGELRDGASRKKDAVEDQDTWLGANVVGLTPDLAANFRQPSDATGVLVTDVDAGSKAEDMGLLAGDIIHAVNQAPTLTVDAFKRVSEHVHLKNGVVMDVLRQGHPIYLSYSKP